MHTIDPQPANFKQMLRTTFALKCPACAKGALFDGIYSIKPKCESCGARYERGSGEWTGAVVITYAVGAGSAFLLWLYLFATDQLFPGIDWVIAGLAVVFSLAIYRNAKAFWIWLIHMAGLVFPDHLAPAGARPSSRPKSADAGSQHTTVPE